MKKSKLPEWEIFFALKQSEIEVSVEEGCRKMGIVSLPVLRTFRFYRKNRFEEESNCNAVLLINKTLQLLEIHFSYIQQPARHISRYFSALVIIHHNIGE